MSILLDAVFLAVSLSHFSIDFLSGQRAVLMTYFVNQLGFSNTVLGFLSMSYVLLGSLSQPVFGYLSDRIGPRILIVGGLIWLGIFFSLGILVPGVLGLVLFILASLGSGAFHPAGTMVATTLGREKHRDKETTSTSIFFLFGQSGLFLGPLLAGIILAAASPALVAVFGLLSVPVALNTYTRLRGLEINRETGPGSGADRIDFGNLGLVLVVFAAIAAFQGWSQQTMITFVPKYLSDLGQSPGLYGLVSALYMGGYALGNVIGGSLADRHGKRRVAAIMFAIASVPILLIPLVELSPWLYVLVPAAGFFTGATFSIIVVLAQRIIPGGQGLASGLILGFIFTAGALGIMLSGYIADIRGLDAVFWLTGLMMFTSAVMVLFLRRIEGDDEG